MRRFVIGDIHGCHRQLMKLLDKIEYTDADEIWFTGDLVSRGPNSLGVLLEISRMQNTVTVLGNHDFHLLYQYYVGRFKEAGYISSERWFSDVFSSQKADDLLHWIKFRPLLHWDKTAEQVMVHAGIHPLWGIPKAQQLAHEVEAMLRSENFIKLLENMYGNQPNVWQDELEGMDRLRIIINVMTRMRYLTSAYELDFTETGPPQQTEVNLIPWYQFNRADHVSIFFGHWASLQGRVQTQQFHGMDGGCVWNGQLMAYACHNDTIIGVDGYES